MNRRSFLASLAALYGLSSLSKPVRLIASTVAGEVEYEPDWNGTYLACGREENGRIYFSELHDHRSVHRIDLADDDIVGMIKHMREVGLSVVRFIDWHGGGRTEGSITVHELLDNGWWTRSDAEIGEGIKACLRMLAPPLLSPRPEPGEDSTSHSNEIVNVAAEAHIPEPERIVEQVHALAIAFRSALMRCDPSELPIGLSTFPRGACGDATLLLARYLAENGFATTRYVLGMRVGDDGDRFSHAWLQIDGLVIDITADQFEDVPHQVIVTRHSAWHDRFEMQEEHESDFRRYDEATAQTLAAAYQNVRQLIDVPAVLNANDPEGLAAITVERE